MIGSAHPRGTCIAVFHKSDVMQTKILYLWDGLVYSNGEAGGSVFIKKYHTGFRSSISKKLDPKSEAQYSALGKRIHEIVIEF